MDRMVLRQNRPNPFNPVTNIGFGIKEQGYISLRIYDVAGRLVCTLVDGNRQAGWHETTWNGFDETGRPAASGVYFCRLVSHDSRRTIKMILLR